jgi:murein DD-endopeptidase MepM/ murein hydrolase activator NlpD
MRKSSILNQSTAYLERLRQQRWPLAILLTTASGMVAAFAVTAPDDAQPPELSRVVEQLRLDTARAVQYGDDNTFLHEDRVVRGDSLGSLLERLKIDDEEAESFIRSAPDTNPIHRQLAPGKAVSAQTDAAGHLIRLNFPLNGNDQMLVVERQGKGFTTHQEAVRYELRTLTRSGEITSSLFAATDSADIPDSIASQLADIFGSDIDFHRDLRKGDRFSVIYEMNYLRGQSTQAGRILAAEFINDGRTYRAFYHSQPDGQGTYYSEDGHSLRKAFLRSPLAFSRVTSGFAMRFHPILQEWRAHKGIDYGAPIGTPVRATSDGIVDFIGRKGGYGNLLVLRHSGVYSTAYGHLNGFAQGLHRGSRVSQGDTIAYVGRTGYATGPHLHYEFRINDKQVNPLSASLPNGRPLAASELPAFRAKARSEQASLALLQQTNNANFE